MKEKNRKLRVKIIEQCGTQSDFAAIIGRSDAFVSRVVCNRSRLLYFEKQRWAAVLKCRVSTIFTDEG